MPTLRPRITRIPRRARQEGEEEEEAEAGSNESTAAVQQSSGSTLRIRRPELTYSGSAVKQSAAPEPTNKDSLRRSRSTVSARPIASPPGASRALVERQRVQHMQKTSKAHIGGLTQNPWHASHANPSTSCSRRRAGPLRERSAKSTHSLQSGHRVISSSS
ncbi:unnamed protein product, partial [Prorocentrum cordatum]